MPTPPRDNLHRSLRMAQHTWARGYNARGMSLASRIARLAAAAACVLAVPLVALDGQPGRHDPSTVIAENGKQPIDPGVVRRAISRRERSPDPDADRDAAGAHPRLWKSPFVDPPSRVR
jgi:hypothetical protein